jgi:hypothetical protein
VVLVLVLVLVLGPAPSGWDAAVSACHSHTVVGFQQQAHPECHAQIWAAAGAIAAGLARAGPR